MKNYKLICAILTMLLMLGTVTGCGNSNSSKKTNPDKTTSTGDGY